LTLAPDISDRRRVIESWKTQGGRLAAVYPIHDPRALLRAHGLLPVEVWGPPGRDTASGDAHLQPYTCSIVRCGLSFLLDGGLEAADLLVVPHACDSLQGLGSVLLDFVRPRQPVVPFYLPRGRGEAHREFLVEELRAMGERLAAVTEAAPDDGALEAAVDREEEADRALGELSRRRGSLGLANRDLYRLLRSREYLPAEQFAALAQEALGHADSAEPCGIPVLLSGLVPEPATVLEAIDEAGLFVVADDLAACGRRLYPGSSRANPWERLADSLLSGPPDSTRGDPVDARLAHLLELAGTAGAAGVIFLTVKFCEPELFYHPLLKAGLERAGLRTLFLEVDVADPLPHALITRLEAFAESLS
jgi:benzoyl-CoA reductase/2-hydroxyglutaryl-CoA dehydratase subunit BcrC/BadD/HgdB